MITFFCPLFFCLCSAAPKLRAALSMAADVRSCAQDLDTSQFEVASVPALVRVALVPAATSVTDEFFQALETGAVDFSNAWKNQVFPFPMLGSVRVVTVYGWALGALAAF